MRGWLLLAPVLLLSGCGGDPQSANGSSGNASVPIIAQPKTKNETANNRGFEIPGEQVVPRETGATSPPPSRPDRHDPISYKAIGTEPFWAVTVKGTTAVLERPDSDPVRFPVDRRDEGQTVRYVGNGFAMTVTEGPCSDGMSDAVWSDRVAVAFGEGTLKGCGGERDEESSQER